MTSPLREWRARFLRTGRELAAATLQRVPERPRSAFLAWIADRMPSPYHDGELSVQRRAGARAQAKRSGLGVGAELPRSAAALIARQRLVVVAASDASGAVWASLLEGAPGFLSAPDPFTLAIDARPADDDPLAAPLAQEADVGILVIDFETRERLRVTGPSALDDSGGGLRVRVRTALENCPRYVKRRALAPSPHAREARDVHELDALDDDVADRLRRANLVFVASRHAEQGADASHKAGAPGFVAVDGPGSLTLPDYSGNGMFQTLGNVEVDGRVGLLVPDFDDGTLLQLTGRARIDWDAAAARAHGKAERLLRIEVERVIVRPGATALRDDAAGGA